MNIEKLKEVVGTIEYLSKVTDTSDSTLLKMLVEYLYDETKGEVFSYFLLIDGIQKEKLKEERNVIMHGLEDAMHAMSHFSGKIDEKDWKSLTAVNQIYFDPTDGNIAFLINIAKAYFPDGTYGHSAQSGVEFFNKFRKLLRSHKDRYLTGDSKDWAIRCGHYDYIKLVLEKDSDNEK
jgi:hypothetical protein